MKKNFALMLSLMAVFALSACGSKTLKPTATPVATATPKATAEPTPGKVGIFSVLVEGVEDITAFNQDYYSDMSETTVTLSISNSKGEKMDYVCRGVYLKDVLAVLGVTDYKSIKVAAADGLKKVYTKEIVNESTSFFAIEVNGETTDCPMTLAASQGSSFSVKQVLIITVNQ